MQLTNQINNQSIMTSTTHSKDDHRTGCRNIKHCQQKLSHSGLCSTGWSNSTYFWNDSWVQTFHRKQHATSWEGQRNIQTRRHGAYTSVSWLWNWFIRELKQQTFAIHGGQPELKLHKSCALHMSHGRRGLSRRAPINFSCPCRFAMTLILHGFLRRQR